MILGLGKVREGMKKEREFLLDAKTFSSGLQKGVSSELLKHMLDVVVQTILFEHIDHLDGLPLVADLDSIKKLPSNRSSNHITSVTGLEIDSKRVER